MAPSLAPECFALHGAMIRQARAGGRGLRGVGETHPDTVTTPLKGVRFHFLVGWRESSISER